MSIAASEARRTLYPLIEQVNEDREAVEIVSRKGRAYLMPAEEYGLEGDRLSFPVPCECPQAPRLL